MIPLISANLPLLTPPTPATAPTPPAGADGAAGGSFAGQLDGAIQNMQDMQSQAAQQVGALLQGKSQDLHASLIAVEKADLAFGMMLQLRNKAVAAYQQIANMQF
ncbi:MAG: flagellar hook-basal body complex protein FliE [Acidobacteria bacterium]|nr:MAG: flagellar hook-basal body complex protein FliE [Acidobacteriota bacterium]